MLHSPFCKTTKNTYFVQILFFEIMLNLKGKVHHNENPNRSALLPSCLNFVNPIKLWIAWLWWFKRFTWLLLGNVSEQHSGKRHEVNAYVSVPVTAKNKTKTCFLCVTKFIQDSVLTNHKKYYSQLIFLLIEFTFRNNYVLSRTLTKQ